MVQFEETSDRTDPVGDGERQPAASAWPGACGCRSAGCRGRLGYCLSRGVGGEVERTELAAGKVGSSRSSGGGQSVLGHGVGALVRW